MEIKEEFLNFITNPKFPCIGAKAASKKKCIDILVAGDLNSSTDDNHILSMLYQFIASWKRDQEHLQTVCVIFKSTTLESETHFEALLWKRLQHLHDLDAQLFLWDKRISSNIEDPHFSFSIGGQGFFIVGLHPHSSRKARQFKYPVLVFNLHAQFEILRKNGVFEKIREKTREADLQYSGTLNPMSQDYGVASEALQYSGRDVPANYVFPFVRKSLIDKGWNEIKPCSGIAFTLKKNDLLIIEDYKGEQVADLYCVSQHDRSEFLSSGKSMDYNNTLKFTTSNTLYSNKSNALLRIIHDDVGVHDFLFSPCNNDTFKLLYDNLESRQGCFEHLVNALTPFGINAEQITTTFNIFMHVEIDPLTHALKILPPNSKKGDKIILQSDMDLIVGLTACSAPMSNNLSCKPIRYKIIPSYEE